MSMVVRYDNETLIPMMMLLGATERGQFEGSGKVAVKLEMEEQEDGLLAETLEPTKIWKKFQQLQGNL